MTITVGLLGAGEIARVHAAALNRIPGVRVGRVVSRDVHRAEAVACLAGDTAWSTDLNELWTDPAITAVDICTRPTTHPDLVIAAAEHGKSILVEKPAALSLDAFDRMAAAAERHGCSLMVGQSTRFQPVHREIAAALATDEIGAPRVLHGTWWAGHTWPGGWRAWQLDPAQSGGQIIHNGVHPIDLAVWLMRSRPKRVFTRAWRTFATGMPTPDSFHVTLRFANDTLALLEWSYGLPKRGDFLRRIMVSGERSSLHHSTELDPTQSLDGAPVTSTATRDAIYHELAHWVATLRGEERPIVHLGEVRAALATAIAAQQSLDSGKAITIEQVAA